MRSSSGFTYLFEKTNIAYRLRRNLNQRAKHFVQRQDVRPFGCLFDKEIVSMEERESLREAENLCFRFQMNNRL